MTIISLHMTIGAMHTGLWQGSFKTNPCTNRRTSSFVKTRPRLILNSFINLLIFIRCSYDFNGIPVKFFTNSAFRRCRGNSTVGYEEGCVYVTLADGHNTTGSIMFGRQYFDQVNKFPNLSLASNTPRNSPDEL